jgi:hypothetical protein
MWERLIAALLRALAYARCDDAALQEMRLARAHDDEPGAQPAMANRAALRRVA